MQVLGSADAAADRCAPRVYACALQTLVRCVPYVSTTGAWAQERVLSLLLRAYQHPASGLGKLFLFPLVDEKASRAPAHAGAPFASMHRVWVCAAHALRAPLVAQHTCARAGALADALEDLVTGLAQQANTDRLALSRRMLALFSEYGLTCDLDTHARNLAALLPAVAAACAAVPASSPASLGRQRSGAAPHAASAMASLEALCAHDSTSVKLFRNAWLYCGMLGLRTEPPRSLVGWDRTAGCMHAAGVLAAATPVLMYGTGVAKQREAEERVKLELQPHLSAAGARGTPEAIATQLKAALARPVRVPAKHTNNAFLLAIATLEVSRAEIGPLPNDPDAPSPLVQPLAYLAGAQPRGIDRAVYHALVERTFEALTARLTSPECSDAHALEHLERLADVIIRVVVWSEQAEAAAPRERTLGGGKHDSRDANELLRRLLQHAPSLYYSPACIRSWAAHGSSAVPERAAAHLRAWLTQAASRAPTHVEHVVQRLAMSDNDEDAALSAATLRPSRLVDAVAAGRERSRMEEVTPTNVEAVRDKSAALGRVEALLDAVPGAASRIAAGATAGSGAGAHKRRCHDLAALVVTRLRSGTADGNGVPLIEALCALPLQQFDGDAMRDVVFAWHWVAAEGTSARDALVTHLLPVWEATIQRGLGLFAGPWSEPAPPLTSGDFAGWDAFAADAPTIRALRAHHLWTLFLTEVWQSSRHAAASPGAASLALAFLGFFRAAAASRGSISTHPLARPTLLRLLALAASFCTHLARRERTQGAAEGEAAQLVADVVDLALRSFAGPARVAMPEGPKQPLDTLNGLDAFVAGLTAVQVRCRAATNPHFRHPGPQLGKTRKRPAGCARAAVQAARGTPAPTARAAEPRAPPACRPPRAPRQHRRAAAPQGLRRR